MAGELPDMPAGDLEQFLADNRAVLKLSPLDCVVYRIRRRRRSVERQGDHLRVPSSSSTMSSSSQLPLLRVVIVGDDTKSKLELLRMILETSPPPSDSSKVAPPRAQAAALEVRQVVSAGKAGTERPTACELFVPPVSMDCEALRAELYAAADCVVLLYSIKNRASFEAIKSLWAKEVRGAIAAAAAAVGAPQDGSKRSFLPIVLVGTDAEVRMAAVGQHAVAVSTHEAVHLAHEVGASKYVEVAAANVAHAKSVLEQAVAAAQPASRSSNQQQQQQQRESSLRGLAIKEHLRCDDPQAVFDLGSRVLLLAPQQTAGATSDTVLLMTTDGSDPLTSATASVVTGPAVELGKPSPKIVRLAAIARCMYPSRVVDISLPHEMPVPTGYVDIALRQFVVQTERLPSAATVRYTVDGSEPSASSPEYTRRMALEGLTIRHLLAAGGDVNQGSVVAPFQAWQGAPLSFRTLKFAAFSESKFRSKIASIEVPELLEMPKATFTPDGTLVVETQPNLEYRYTLDGSVPTYYGSLHYARPVMLPKDPALRQIRVAAFPRLALPSRELVLDVTPPPPAHRDPAVRSIATTRATMSRTEAAQQKRRAVSPADRPVMLVAPGSKDAEAVVRTRSRSPVTNTRKNSEAPPPPPLSTVKRGNNIHAGVASPQQGAGRSPSRRAKTPPTSTGAASAAHRSSTHPAQPAASQHQPAAAAGNGSTGSAPKCHAQDNVVTFDFPQPILLSHITVATPGSQGAPSSYEIHVQHALAASFIVVGEGQLEDVAGVQTMHVIASAKSLPVIKVKCVFVSDGAFFVHDMKVHGKPFNKEKD